MATPVRLNKKYVQNEIPLVVIVGPTASGKSSLAMQIARAYNGEIIAADSRTVYRHLDIGTAKPSKQDQLEVPHWGIDLVEPGSVFSAADFKEYANEKIAQIRARRAVPILVGGTGLYVDGVIFNYQFGATNTALRKVLTTATLEELKTYCYIHNIDLPENYNNRRYVMRAIEQGSINNNRDKQPLSHTIIVGITTDTHTLRTQIAERAEHLLANGMLEEARMLGKTYGWDSEAMTGNIYRLVRQYLEGEFDETLLKQRFITADWQLAKRQLTWFKRNPFIHWASRDDAYAYLAARLEQELREN